MRGREARSGDPQVMILGVGESSLAVRIHVERIWMADCEFLRCLLDLATAGDSLACKTTQRNVTRTCLAILVRLASPHQDERTRLVVEVGVYGHTSVLSSNQTCLNSDTVHIRSVLTFPPRVPLGLYLMHRYNKWRLCAMEACHLFRHSMLVAADSAKKLGILRGVILALTLKRCAKCSCVSGVGELAIVSFQGYHVFVPKRHAKANLHSFKRFCIYTLLPSSLSRCTLCVLLSRPLLLPPLCLPQFRHRALEQTAPRRTGTRACTLALFLRRSIHPGCE